LIVPVECYGFQFPWRCFLKKAYFCLPLS
jgi:hypothetical protein